MRAHLLFKICFLACLFLFNIYVYGQTCQNPSIDLPDTSVDVDGNPNNAYCVDFSFDPAITGVPEGLEMQLEHSWQGDLSIFVTACGNTLSVLQRPGAVGNCTIGSSLGFLDDIGDPLTGTQVSVSFLDAGGPDPENGIAVAGGAYAISSDDACGVGTPGITSFADLFAACPPGLVSSQICIADHALLDNGSASDITYLFPNAIVCGCTDPASSNYDPSANVDDGSCIPPPPCTLVVNATASQNNVCAGNTLSLSSSFSGETGSATGVWSSIDGSDTWLDDVSAANPDFTPPSNESGSFTLTYTVTDDICSESMDVNITVNPLPQISITSITDACFGQSNGEVQINSSNGNNPYTVTISGPVNDSDTGGNTTFSNLAPGNYTVTVEDDDSCTQTANFSIGENAEITPTITGPTSFCEGGSTTLGLSTSYSSYDWSTGDDTPTTTTGVEGTVTVTVTDSEGCEGTVSVDLTESNGINTSISGQDYFCTGGSTTISAPAGFSSYEWSNTASSESIDVSTTGTYSVTVTDASGCEGIASIDISEAALPEPTIEGPDLICGAGTITLNVAETFDAYVWSTTENGNSIDINSANTYSVTVTDANQCMGSASHNVTLAPPIDVSIEGVLTYCAETAGTTLTVAGGYVSYEWSTNETGVTSIIADNPGTYSVTVEDNDGCLGEASVEVSTFDTPTPEIDGLDAVCQGGSTTLTVTDGYASYEWSNNNMTNSIDVSSTGTYAVTVIDDNDCTATVFHDFTVNDLPEPTISGETAFCTGEEIELTVTGGIFSSYQWSTGESTVGITTMEEGEIIVTVTDGNDCQNTATISIAENPLPEVEISGDLSICENGDGLLVGTPGYNSYNWSTNDTGESISITAAGTYQLTVTDENNCSNSTAETVGLFATPEPEILGDTRICPDSEIELMAIGDFQSYTWSNNESSTSTTVFDAGIYTLTVTDENDCEGETSIEIEQAENPEPQISGDSEICEGIPEPLSVQDIYSTYEWSTGDEEAEILTDGGGSYSVTVTNEDGCEGEAEFIVTEYAIPIPYILNDEGLCGGNSVDLEAEGGYESYLWNTDETDNIITITEPGTYEVTVTTSADCEGTASIDITDSSGDPITIEGDDQLCFGQDGELFVEGDFEEVLWSTDSDEMSIEVSTEGTYSVTVTYSSGCTATNSIDVSSSEAIDLSFTGATSFCEGESTILGLSEDFETYFWSTGAQSPQITIAEEGDVTVEVTDEYGCAAETTIFIEELALPSAEITGNFSYCAGSSTTLNGPDDLTYSWSNAAETQSITVSNSQDYGLTVTDADGCQNTDNVTIEEAEALSPSIDGDLDICEGGSTNLSVSENFAAYLWSDDSTDPFLTTDVAGIYGLTVEDDEGCLGTTEVEVIVAPNPILEILGETSFCSGGSSTLSTNEGFSAYLWSDGTMEPSLSVNAEGEVSLTVENEFGCETTTDIFITVFDAPAPTIAGDVSLCFGESTQLSIQDENFQSILWHDGTNELSTNVSSAGLVSVEVISADGCLSTAEVEITQAEELNVVIIGEDEICEGAITTLAVNDSFETYNWSNNEETSTIEIGDSGEVSVLVEDADGCAGEAFIEITTHDLPTVNIDGSLAYCPGGATVLSVAEGFQSYSWSNNEETNSITVNSEESFSVTVTDENGCQNEDQVSVEVQEELSPIINGALAFCEGQTTTLDAGSGFETYVWSNTAMESEITVTEAGEYTVTVEDAFGCSGSATVEVAMNTLPTPQITGDLFFCEGTSTTLNAGNFETYEWSNTAIESAFISVSEAGNYSLTVTDENNCQGETTVAIEELAAPEPAILGIAGFCPNQSTLLTGTDGFIAYQWSSGTSGASIEMDTIGTIGLTVTDENNCQGETALSVEEFVVQTPTIIGENMYCPGTSTILQAPNEFASFTWSTGSQETMLEVSQPSMISLFVTDENNCETSTVIEITEFEVLTPQITAPEGFCAGSSAIASIPDNYISYNWTTGGNTPAVTVNAGGLIEVNVIDQNNCTSNAIISIEEYDLPQPQIGGSLSYCIGNSTTLNAGADYTSYSWSSGDDSPEIMVGNPGEVGLTVTDEHNCEGNTTAQITEATELSPVISGALTFCTGENTSLSVGSGFENYEWSNGAETPEITVSEPGNYAIIVEDNSGCAGTAFVEVFENPLPQPEIIGALAFCAGTNTQLQLSETYQNYNWSNGSPAEEIVITTEGNISVTVTDNNNCVNETSAVVEELALPVFEIEGQMHYCAGSSTVITVNPNFENYEWSVGDDNAPSITINNAGIVGVTVTDDSGCVNQETTTITEVSLPIADAGNNFILNCFTEAVTLGGGGTPSGSNYSYEWTGPGLSPDEAILENPTTNISGTYALTVFNTEFGCQSEEATVEVTDETNEPVVVLAALNEINCETSTAIIDGAGSENGPEVIYQWYDQGLNEIEGAQDVVYAATAPGLFFLEVLDTITGCDNIQSIEVFENIAYPIAEAGDTQALNCLDISANLDGTLSQNDNTIIYQWYTTEGEITNGDQTEMATVTEPGWYYIQVIDENNNCQNIDSVFVSQDIVNPMAEAGPEMLIDCHNTTATLAGQGSSIGTQYSYQWFLNGDLISGATTLEFTTETGGLYTLEVTNTDNHCATEDQTVIAQNTEAPAGITANIDQPTCFGDEDGSIIIQAVEGGLSPYSYSVDGAPFSLQTSYQNLAAGLYEIGVEDANGCFYATTLNIDPGNDLSLNLGSDITINYGESVTLAGAASVDLSELIKITWEANVNLSCENCLIQENLQLEQTDGFTLTVQDENGCIAEDQITVFVKKSRPVFIPTAFSPNGDGQNDVLFINGGGSVEKIKSFLVFNRWGETIFEVYNTFPNDPTWGWNGKHREEDVNAAMYVYMAEIEFADGETIIYSGEVMVMR